MRSPGERWEWRVELDGDRPSLLVSGKPRGVGAADNHDPTVTYRIEPPRVPSVLDMLRARSNVTWSKTAKRVKLRRAPARLRLVVDYDEEGAINLAPYVDLTGTRTPARPIRADELFTDAEGTTWIVDGLGFSPVARKAGTPVEQVLAGQLPSRVAGLEIPVFLGQELTRLSEHPSVRVADRVKASRVMAAPSLKSVQAKAERKRDGAGSGGIAQWFMLDPTYTSGGYNVSLEEILGAGKSGWLRRGNDWIPIERDALLDSVAPIRGKATDEGLRVPRVGLLRASATWENSVRIDRDRVVERLLDRLSNPESSEPPPKVDTIGMHGALRHYQELGYRWLWWLRESGFGGILADEMGLGKTHEVMALLLGIYAVKKKPDRPSLVICPRSVLDHWEIKIKSHAPSLSPMVYHGLAREKKPDRLRRERLVLTTYGIVPRSAKVLAAIDWEYVVLDEAQKIKNAETVTARFVRTLRAEHRLAITGTPIENRASELWSIIEFLIPGYLGSAQDFHRRFTKPIEAGDRNGVESLRRAIRPFKLRRLKQDVLKELPKKVEDYRICRLSPHQAAIYKEILSRRAKPLVEQLNTPNAQIEYIHIFAVLSMLKRLCDHPRLVTQGKKGQQMLSGKFEAFKELLEEIVDADEKVVVFSQYLEMLDLIEEHLTGRKIGFAKLRGSTVNRQDELHRFRDDPTCRVFVGSLLAGGLGIDLTAASVVIHYDRWWNAARENQATDRVHRIGQERGVQVWKLVTHGTLEERIDGMIRQKGAFMDSVVESDEWGSLKAFSRDELIELLSPAS